MRKIISYLAIVAGFLALITLAIAGPLYQLGVAQLSSAFLLLRWAAYIGAGAAIVGLILLIWQALKPSEKLPSSMLLGLAVIAAGVSFILPYLQLQTARSVPPIHDISTDLTNPPAFIAIAPLRANAPNPVEYAGEETAQQQRQAYSDITTWNTSASVEVVYQQALKVVADMGWELVASDLNEGRIEATDTTTWFGFKDDVVIRLVATETGSALDIRSKSRVGRSDVGVNAKRIRAFLSALEQAL
jgi:uncharacterized protein (DUF1499 family)